MKVLLTTICCLTVISKVYGVGKISCFYDHKAIKRVDLAKVGAEELKPALPMCNYLIYGFIGIDDDDYKAESLDKDIDTEKGKNTFKNITALKKSYPGLKVLVSVGGFKDEDEPDKYLKVLESQKTRGDFVTSLVKLIKTYDFDGADLAWQFPVVKEKKERSTVESIWHSIKKTVSGSSKDTKEKDHKEQFSALCKELSSALRGENKILTLSVLPHVNATVYYDGNVIKDSVELIHLMTYDYRTPERSSTEADYSASLQYVYDRVPHQNVEATVKTWLENKVPANKLLIAIPTFGRTWTLTKDSGKSGVPPVKKADGPGEAGPYVKTAGYLSYFEICPYLISATTASESLTLLRKVPDTTYRQGTYAFRVAKDSAKGIWVSYEDTDVAAKKAQYAKQKGLGGVAIVDLTMDDFKGTCDATKTLYPILRSAKLNI